MMLLVVAGLLILSLTSVASSSIVGWLTLSDGLGFADSGKLSSAGVMFGKTVYSLVPYTLLALFFTVLTPSTGKGIALVLGYYFIELFAAGALFARFGWFHHISDFLLGPNIAGWIEGGPKLRRQAAWFKFHWQMCRVIYMPLWYLAEVSSKSV